MSSRHTYRPFARRILYFFPVQLLLLHLKKNHVLLLVWALLFGYVTELIGVKYGLPYLFLFPEYFGQVGPLSFLITGFALGGLITAFNLYTYTLHGYRFPFVATLARPLLKFNINNAAIPAAFTLVYLWCSARFQYHDELLPPGRIAIHLACFLLGIALFLMLALLYFMRTNIDIVKLTGRTLDDLHRAPEHAPTPPPDAAPKDRQERRQATRWLRRAQRSEKWRVETYLTPRMRIALARSSAHYDRDLLRTVLWRNQVYGAYFEVAVLVSFVVLGAFSDHRFFAVPAGASAFLLFTMLIMLISALFSWWQGWTYTLLVLLALGVHLLSTRTDLLHDSHAFGMDHRPPPVTYDRAHVMALANDSAAVQHDTEATLRMLEAWKRNNVTPDGRKPRLVVINTSGGGQRALLWSFLCMQRADSMLGGGLMRRTALITGSSGGAIGAAYFRQLAHLDRRQGTHLRYDPAVLQEISSDMLNPVAFNFVTHDMFVRYRRVHDGPKSYRMDRGHAFDQRLNEVTRGVLNIRLDDMAQAEQQAETPLLVVAPASINDGRRVIMSASPVAYLVQNRPAPGTQHTGEPDAIEFRRMFAAHDAGQITLTSALRTNATFPYITPVVTMPSEPPMRLMDAGLLDNHGHRVTMAFLFTFREWIAANTSGVVVLQLRDTPKGIEPREAGRSMLGRLLAPMGTVYDNVVRGQDLEHDRMMQMASAWSDFPITTVELELHRPREEPVSLSWHLTALERRRVFRSLDTPQNHAALRLLQQLVEGPAVALTTGRGSAADPATGPAQRP